ncbi:MAG: hypothetical protein WCS86_00135 [Candidatus Paceibacterota bacterium]
MADPIRTKKVSIFAETKVVVEGKELLIKLNTLVDADKFLALSEEEKKTFLLQEANKTSPTPVSGIFTLNSSFKYVNPSFLKEFNYGNVLVELNIPYCLHIPNGYELEVMFSKDTKQMALIIPSKIWTQKAQTNKERSDETDFFADDRVLYFRKNAIVGPKMPLDLSEGWEQNYTGFNVNRIKDRNGRFRFTHLYIQFDLTATEKELENKFNSNIVIEKVKDITFQVVNKLIDAYRFTTNEEYITRLGEVSLTMIYFIDLNQGIYLSQVNTEVAPMNRSKPEIEKIEEMLDKGDSPDLYTLLLLDAQNSFNTKNYPLAVVQSFQALEIFIENFLIKGFIDVGKTEIEASDYIIQSNNWMTKTRLKELLKEIKGKSLQEIDQSLWDKWCTTYDVVRTAVIHKGKEPIVSEIKNTLENNFQVIELLKSLV